MLKNPIYKGVIVEKKMDLQVPGDFDALVSPELWATVQAVSGCAVSVRKETMEQMFVETMQPARPRPEYVTLFRSVVLDVWRQRGAEVERKRAALQARVDSLVAKRGKLVSRYLDDKIAHDVYKRTENSLTEQIGDARLALAGVRERQDDVDELLTFAERVLLHPGDLWRGLPPQSRLHLQQLVFPGGLAFNGESFETPKTSVVFDILAGSGPEGMDMVAPTCYETVVLTRRGELRLAFITNLGETKLAPP